MNINIEAHGFEEASKEIGRQIRDLSAEGIDEYCQKIKLDAKKLCGLTDEQLLLRAVKGEDGFNLEVTLNDKSKWECLKKIIESKISEMTPMAQGIFRRFIEDNDKRCKETPAS